MVRHIAAALVALCLCPSLLSAQTTTIKVTVPSADVYAGPSTGTPVIGHVPSGTVLVVTRELGSWVRVNWPAAQDGNGFVHVSKGTMSTNALADNRPAGSPSSMQATARRPVTAGNAPVARARSGEQPVVQNPLYVVPPSHIFGVGGLIAGPNAGFGASARAWSRERFGIQFDVARYAVTSAVVPDRVRSVQFEPSLLYSIRDHVTDYWWLRPYVGSGVSVQHQTFTSAAAPTLDPVSDNGVGYHVFGGGEIAFASLPRFAISADVSYRWLDPPFVGFETNGLGIAVSGRWYVR